MKPLNFLRQLKGSRLKDPNLDYVGTDWARRKGCVAAGAAAIFIS